MEGREGQCSICVAFARDMVSVKPYELYRVLSVPLSTNCSTASERCSGPGWLSWVARSLEQAVRAAHDDVRRAA